MIDLLWSRPATAGVVRLLGIDGPGGSGKTTLAGAVEQRWPRSVRVVHMDDLYDGWGGLDGVGAQLSGLLEPLAAGRAGCYRRYDWHARALAESVPVEPADLVVVEGVGAGSAPTSGLLTALVWVEAPRPVRLARGLERDGDALRGQWLAWQDSEDRHFAEHRTRSRADVVVDGR